MLCGKSLSFQYATNTPNDFSNENYPPFEQELEWIRQDQELIKDDYLRFKKEHEERLKVNERFEEPDNQNGGETLKKRGTHK